MKRAITAAALLAAAVPAMANDSVAETAAGGLVLKRSDAIDMVSEDLFVSAAEVRVAYVFRNRTAKPVTTIVAFPLPDRDLAAEFGSDVSFPSGFRTRVEGKPVAMTVEHKALLEGADRTAELQRLGVPLSGEGIRAALDRLPAATQARLVKSGLAIPDEYDSGKGWEKHLAPAWSVRETWYWTQTFPAGRDLKVEHAYAPGTGASVDSALSIPELRRSAEGARMIARYCVDAAFLAGIERIKRSSPYAPEQRIGYVLTTGANWRAPIGRFRLMVDKGSADNLVSFCGEGVRKVSPTRFEMIRTNWRPARDLDVVIVSPRLPGG
jgi:hypothetical protein